MTPLSKLPVVQLYDVPDHNQPPRKYTIGTTIKVPKKVCEAGKATISGYEWGPNLGRSDQTQAPKRSDGWIYYLKFPNEEGLFHTNEQEIDEWQT